MHPRVQTAGSVPEPVNMDRSGAMSRDRSANPIIPVIPAESGLRQRPRLSGSAALPPRQLLTRSGTCSGLWAGEGEEIPPVEV